MLLVSMSTTLTSQQASGSLCKHHLLYALPQHPEVRNCFCILQMQEPRLRQVQELAQSLNAVKWKSQDLNPRVTDSEVPVAGHSLFIFPCRERNDHLGFSKRWCDSFFAIALMLVSHLCGCTLLTPSRQWAGPWSKPCGQEKASGQGCSLERKVLDSSHLSFGLLFHFLQGPKARDCVSFCPQVCLIPSIAAPLVGPLCMS